MTGDPGYAGTVRSWCTADNYNSGSCYDSMSEACVSSYGVNYYTDKNVDECKSLCTSNEDCLSFTYTETESSCTLHR